jgi:hypothetical protein
VPRAVDHEDEILDVFIQPRRGEVVKTCSSRPLLRQSFAHWTTPIAELGLLNKRCGVP